MGSLWAPRVSSVPMSTKTTARTATAAMAQKTERKPKAEASQPPARASTPAIPPLTEARTAIHRAYFLSSFIWARSMMRAMGTMGPETP